MALVRFPSFRVLSTLPAELRVESMREDFGGSGYLIVRFEEGISLTALGNPVP